MPVKGGRIVIGMTRLSRRLETATEKRSVQQAADEWGVPYWVIRDTLRGATDCPRPRYLPALARGLGISIEELIEDAYSPAEPAVAH